MEIKKHPNGHVDVWLRKRYLEVGDPGDHDSKTIEVVPSFTLTDDQMNALVVEWLRGPMGPVGPMGASGKDGTVKLLA